MKLKKLLLVLGLVVSFSASAAYQNLAPPPGWSGGTAASGAVYDKAIANAAWSSAKTVSVTASANVGGRVVAVPTLLRMGAGAAGTAARFMFLNPWTQAALVAAPFAIKWALDSGFKFQDGHWVKDELECANGTCQMYQVNNLPKSFTKAGACAELKANYPNVVTQYTSDTYNFPVAADGVSCEIRETYTSVNSPQFNRNNVVIGYAPLKVVPQAPGTVVPRIVPQPEFEEEIKKKPMPWQVPNELPVPMPVDAPVINPNPSGTPSPLLVPWADPVPIPNTDPQQYSKPVAKITPSTTADNPWRVDVKQEDVVSTDPTPIPDPATPQTPSEDTDICKANPGILACEKGSATDTPLPSVPDLYTQKYPDGLVGIWNDKKQQLTGSSLVGLLSSLMPSVSGGSCPSINLNLDVGVVNFGRHDISPPCEIWTFGKWVIIISALLLARSLVFGG